MLRSLSHIVVPAISRQKAHTCAMAKVELPPGKRRQLAAADGQATIGTHSGSFHCDEALGCYLLRLLPEYEDAKIIRSRDPKRLEECNVVLDVGGVYDAKQKRFDHHQKGFMEVFPGFNTKLSSAGLVYKHFGRQIIAKLTYSDQFNSNGKPHEDSLPAQVSRYPGAAKLSKDMELIYNATYKYFVEALDAIDNGINQWEGSQIPKYVSNTNLSSRVGQLNPDWNSPLKSDADLDTQFYKAMDLAGSEFVEKVTWLTRVWLPARDIVEAAISGATSIDPSGEIILLETGCPWKEHLYDLEKDMALKTPIKYVLYGDKDSCRVQAVGHAGSFESRKALPAEWRGIRDEALSEVSGIPGCVFVHASGFIGGNKTLEGATQMAKKALQS